MNSFNVDTLKAGEKLMDSLSKTNYVPAMYEIAFTYGWYSDPKSVRRKEMLGIKMNNNNFPLDDKNNNKAKGLLSSILEINDTLYPEINSEAAYRLACYYGAIDGSKDGKNKVDTVEAKKHLDIAEKWANMSNDTAFSKKMKDDINFNRKRNLLNPEFPQE